MRKSHQIGFNEYEGKIKDQLKVEKKRDKEYKDSQSVTAEYDKRIYK